MSPGKMDGEKEVDAVMAERPKRPNDLVDAIICAQRRKDPTDVLGSWTGVPWDEWEEPVQDADDL